MVDVYRARKVTGAEFDVEGAIGYSFTLDATVRESHSMTAEVPKHPVEEGFEVSDHVQPTDVVLSIEGVISNAPLPSQGEATRDRDLLAWQTIESLLELGERVSVRTSLRTYDDMIVTSVATDRSSGIGEAIRPVIEMQKIRVVQSETVDVPNRGRVPVKGPPPSMVQKAEHNLARQEWISQNGSAEGFDSKYPTVNSFSLG